MSSPKSLFELVADPVRLALLRVLADREQASLAELADGAAVHPNTVRRHLEGLEDEGAVERVSSADPRRGRPRVYFRLAEGWSSTEAPTGLAELLASLVQRLDPDPAELEEFGRQWGAFLASRPGRGAGMASAGAALEQLGYEVRTGGEIELRGCPCPIISPDDPGLVCGLARSVAEGALRSSDDRTRLRSVSHDPRARRCTLRVVAR
jgi:predicted ArsR family transcriptional regulator